MTPEARHCQKYCGYWGRNTQGILQPSVSPDGPLTVLMTQISSSYLSVDICAHRLHKAQFFVTIVHIRKCRHEVNVEAQHQMEQNTESEVYPGL